MSESGTGWKDIPLAGLILEAGNAAHYKTGAWRAFRPVWGEAKCVQCFICWVYCPDTSILTQNGQVLGFDLEHCKGCGICAAECPVNKKVRREAEKEGQTISRDDPRLCIRMVEEKTI
ncbi:MAG: 4Fe-4S dicluster-binding protein [Anaerolineae bacterium]